MNFINAFEELVIAGIRALGRLKSVEHLRIRYVDLGKLPSVLYVPCLCAGMAFANTLGYADSPFPPLNPYFLLRDNWCSGVWSDAIVAELNRSRPEARFEELSESFGEMGYHKNGRFNFSGEFPKSKAMSIKLSNYALLSAGISSP
jgi:hypothetical protein